MERRTQRDTLLRQHVPPARLAALFQYSHRRIRVLCEENRNEPMVVSDCPSTAAVDYVWYPTVNVVRNNMWIFIWMFDFTPTWTLSNRPKLAASPFSSPFDSLPPLSSRAPGIWLFFPCCPVHKAQKQRREVPHGVPVACSIARCMLDVCIIQQVHCTQTRRDLYRPTGTKYPALKLMSPIVHVEKKRKKTKKRTSA